MPKNKKNRYKIDKVVVVVIIIVAAFAGGFFVANKLSRNDRDDKAAVSDVVVNNNAESKESQVAQHDSAEIAKEDDKTPEKYDGEDANNFGELSGTVTFAGIAGNKLMIRVNIDQFLASGTCSLTIGGYSSDVNISSSASTSTCEGFDIPLSDLSDLSGETEFSINLSSGDKQGLITGSVQL